MLETILNEINNKLGRIADALEVRENTGITAGELIGTQAQKNTAEAVSVPQKVVENQSIEISQEPVAQIPTAQQGFTREQLAVAMSNAVAAGKMATIQNVLQQFNVQALTQINPAEYNKVATLLKEAGVEV